jgi:hypothetical protein
MIHTANKLKNSGLSGIECHNPPTSSSSRTGLSEVGCASGIDI